MSQELDRAKKAAELEKIKEQAQQIRAKIKVTPEQRKLREQAHRGMGD